MGDYNRDIVQIDYVLAHVRKVEANAEKLGKALILNGEFNLGRSLIVAGRLHDISKFSGIEWEYLSVKGHEKTGGMIAAIQQHNSSLVNLHHPEANGGIEFMSELSLAEMVCDWAARSSEKGKDLEQWIENTAMQRYRFNKTNDVYKRIMRFVNMLLEPVFT